MKFIFLVVGIFFSSILSFAQTTPSLSLLSFNQFSRLNNENKNLYIKELRKTVNQLDNSQGFYSQTLFQNSDLFAQLFVTKVEAQLPPPDPPAVVPDKPKPTVPTTPAQPPKPSEPKNEPPIQPNPSQCLRCIYGGFIIAGNKNCRPIKSLGKPIHHNQGEMKLPAGLNSKDFKCTGGDILCNPMLYGWGANNKPHCLSAGKNASESCGNTAGSDEESYKRAKELIDLNKDSFEKLKFGLEQICKSENLCKRSNNEKSKADIAETCEAVRKSIEAFKAKAGLTAEQAPKLDAVKTGVE